MDFHLPEEQHKIETYKFWYWLPCRIAVYINIFFSLSCILTIIYFFTRLHIGFIEQILNSVFDNTTTALFFAFPISWLIQFIYLIVLKERTEYNGVQLRYPDDVNIGRFVYYITFLPQLLVLVLLFYFIADPIY